MEKPVIRLLMIDDDDDFRAAVRGILTRRGFDVVEAPTGADALATLRAGRPDIVLLDLKMPGMSGIETLRRIREIEPELPVIILTGHGRFDDALAGIKLEIVDFLQKPVDAEQLARRLHALLERGQSTTRLRERTIRELMKAPSDYPRLHVDQPVGDAFEILRKVFFEPEESRLRAPGVRSALVFDRQERFLGLVRFSDLLKLVLPGFLATSPYTTFFTGMFLAQCKVIGNRTIEELMEEPIQVDVDAPLLEAVSLMVRHHVISLPVMDRSALVGILRERDIVLEIANNLGSLG